MGKLTIISTVCAYTAVNLRNYNSPGMFRKAINLLPSTAKAPSASVKPTKSAKTRDS